MSLLSHQDSKTFHHFSWSSLHKGITVVQTPRISDSKVSGFLPGPAWQNLQNLIHTTDIPNHFLQLDWPNICCMLQMPQKGPSCAEIVVLHCHQSIKIRMRSLPLKFSMGKNQGCEWFCFFL